MDFPLQAIKNYSFRLNCTFRPFDISLLTKSKLACNLGTGNASLIHVGLILRFFHDDLDNFDNTIITLMHIEWSNYLIRVK